LSRPLSARLQKALPGSEVPSLWASACRARAASSKLWERTVPAAARALSPRVQCHTAFSRWTAKPP